MTRPMIDFVWLKNLQTHKGLQLTTCETPAGTVHVDGQPAAFVTELIRLAEIGQKLEIATAGAVATQGTVPRPFTPWGGGGRPHPPATYVLVRYRNGSFAEGQSAFVRWWHEGDGEDVVAYYVPPFVAPAQIGDCATKLDEETVARAHVAWIQALGTMPESVEVIMTTDQARVAIKAAIEAALLWIQPAQ
jgi:hypothetical protein